MCLLQQLTDLQTYRFKICLTPGHVARIGARAALNELTLPALLALQERHCRYRKEQMQSMGLQYFWEASSHCTVPRRL